MKEMVPRLKEVMKEKGVKQNDLAEKLGVTSQYISGIVTGRLGVSLKRLYEIAEILDVEPVSLLKGNENVFCCPHCGRPIKVAAIEED